MNISQKLSVAASTAVLALGVCASSAQAGSLVGQTIRVDYLFPDLNTLYRSQFVTVAADSSDKVNLGFVTADPSDLGFSITVPITTSFTPSPFNGFKFSNLNFGDNSFITGVLIGNKTGAFTAFNASDVSFTNNSVSLNFESIGLGFEGNTKPGDTLNVSLQTARPVPVPGAILGVVVAGGALVARQRKNAKAKQTVA